MAHVDTQAIPALDAWKKVCVNRDESVDTAYKLIRSYIASQVSECKTSLTLDHRTWECSFERVGYWPFGKYVPVSTTRQLFERLENDGFTVTWRWVEFQWLFTVSWDFSDAK